ncbi:TetR/AcrR family transcriptional regulator [Streptomyces sp. NPDC047072]|uniref:TetR/AcrR family transcriptional regulator n=1 Tax=Streptomyces sp. NPDC047072 TaxID=3154809 RepID=UPI0033F1D1D2
MDSDSAALRRTPRRRSRLSPQRKAELYAAVLDLLREVGYDTLTMGAVAARARCSKATLYRQWAGKPELVAQALRRQKPVTLADIDTGSLRGDLSEMVVQADHRRLAEDTALLRGLAQAAQSHPDLFEALRDLVIDPELAGLDALLSRAVERQEISAGSPARTYVPHALLGALIAHELVEEGPADRTFLRDYVDGVILPALTAAP